MKFIRSQKAQSVPSSTSPSKLPRGGSSRENIPLENVSKQSDSPSAAENPQEVTMEGEEERGEGEGVPRPPAVMGMTHSFIPCQFFLASGPVIHFLTVSLLPKLSK